MPRTRAPEQIETDRLILRRPTARDVVTIFETYASDPDVTRYVGWPKHAKRGETRTFLAYSDAQWRKWPAGPYVVLLRNTRMVIGGTGLVFETPRRASTGYVFARRAWGHGYATEALRAMVRVAADCGIVRLYAICHHGHEASVRVLEKGGFTYEGTLRRFAEFPNLEPGVLCDVRCYSIVFENLPGTEGKMRS
jgi:ribosomal-protein-alanine N-acetyltransferase